MELGGEVGVSSGRGGRGCAVRGQGTGRKKMGWRYAVGGGEMVGEWWGSGGGVVGEWWRSDGEVMEK